MRKILATAACIGFMSTAASAVTVDAFALNVTSAAGTDSSFVLLSGQTYEVKITGTFQIGTAVRRHLTDAEFFNLGATNSGPIDAGSVEIGVGIDGADVDFGAFNPSSVYTTRVVGNDRTINVFFNDSFYGDNSGSLGVEISAVPLPAGAALLLTALGGLGLYRRRKTA